MPAAVNGCGTTYYGRHQRLEDGSYITTEWIVVLYVPLIPVGSFRVWPTGENQNYIIYNSQKYYTQPVPLCRRQVVNTYLVLAVAALAIAPVLLLLWFPDSAVIHTYAMVALFVTMIAGLIISRQQNRR